MTARDRAIADRLRTLGYRATVPGEPGWYVTILVEGERVTVHACDLGVSK